MKSYRKELWFETGRRRELINISPDAANRPAALILLNESLVHGFLLYA